MSSVDVIVPCYRYARFLRECVTSVLAQRGPAVRVLIVNDASPDNTSDVAAQLAHEDSRVTVLTHATNQGHIATYNEGIQWASAKYLLVLSADDYLLPDALALSVDLMDEHADVGFTFGKAVDLVDGGTLARKDTLPNGIIDSVTGGERSRIISGAEFFKLIASSRSINVVRTPTAVVRTEVQKHVGGYRPELPHAGDLEMWLRLAAHSSVGVISAPQAAYRFHGNNMQVAFYGSRCLADLQQRKAAIDSVFTTCGSKLNQAPELRRELLEPLAYEALEYASAAFNENDVQLSETFTAFARDADENIRLTLRWILLACKRYMGVRAARALLPVVSRLRRAAARFGN
jgi:GT2 family glycosyltransferase